MRWWGAGAVAATFALVAVVLPAIDEAVSPERVIAEGTVYELDTVSFTPTPGWSLDVAGSSLAPGRPTVRVYDGGVRFVVSVEATTRSAVELLGVVSRDLTGSEGAGAVDEPAPVVNAAGLEGVRQQFVAANDDITLTVFVADGVGITVLTAATSGSLDDDAVAAMEDMIDGLQIGPAEVGGES